MMYNNSKCHEQKLKRQLEHRRVVVAFISWGEPLQIKKFRLQGNLKINLASKVAPRTVIAQNTIQACINS